MDWNVVIGGAGVIVSVVTWYAGLHVGRRHEAGVNEWRQEVRTWASECIDVLTDAAFPPVVEDAERARNLKVSVSALVDRGRLFFTNEGVSEEDDPQKPTAFRGHRASVLDHLVAAHNLLRGADVPAGVSRERTILELRKEFVSELQTILQPAKHNRQLHEAIHGTPSAEGALTDRRGRGEQAALDAAIARAKKHAARRSAA